MKRSTKKIYVMLALASLVLSSCAQKTEETNPTAPAFKTLSEYQNQSLKWTTCHDYFKCATLKVPIDYSNLTVGTFEIAVIKYPALKPSTRLGSIVVNPGGPGASGVDYAIQAEYYFDVGILDRFDIVGFDPRGVARSAPIKCLSDKETDQAYAEDTKPDNPAELAAYIDSAKKYAAKCVAKNKYLAYFGTSNAARDMDLLRAALGEEKLNYLGKSYGTYLGTIYASLFPDKVGKFVLDGAIDPNISTEDQNLSQAIGFDSALGSFIDDCYKHKDCALPQPHEQAVEAIKSLLKSTQTNPLPTKSKRVLTESLLVIGIATALYDNQTGWPELRTAFQEAQNGKGDAFLKLADLYSNRDANGNYSDNEYDSGIVIDCLDWKADQTLNQIKSNVSTFTEKAPVFGPYIAYAAVGCREFSKLVKKRSKNSQSSSPQTIQVQVSPIKTNPVVIIGVTRDPATPYSWSEALHDLFPGSTLISLNADGHTGQGRGSRCVDKMVDKYLLFGFSENVFVTCY